mmetsp:Transcript_26492/g.69658  ORF Transcript_26492/g.69658 Transcript_26492/m.69658 type:complete len:144 (-) Transcript_26492:533-964(-)
MTNPDPQWLHDRGTWLFYLALIGFVRYSMFVLGVATDSAWTLLVIGHSVVSYWLCHCKRGSLLDFNAWNGKYDKLTYWEQVDGGRHYSNNRKFLMIVPTVLLFISYYFTSRIQFLANVVFTVFALLPKLPMFSMNSRYVFVSK